MLRLVLTAMLKMSATTSGLGKRFSLGSIPAAATTVFIRSSWSSRSMIENPRRNPSTSAWRRRILLPMEWNVPPQSPSVLSGSRVETRSSISRAALFVKVSSRMLEGSTPFSSR